MSYACFVVKIAGEKILKIVNRDLLAGCSSPRSFSPRCRSARSETRYLYYSGKKKNAPDPIFSSSIHVKTKKTHSESVCIKTISIIIIIKSLYTIIIGVPASVPEHTP